MNHFIKKVIQSIFVDQQAGKNPYWGAYLGFDVPPEYQSPYLQPTNFDRLQSISTTLKFSSGSLYDYLKSTDKTFSHFVLLDHMDWMTDHSKTLLANQWKLLFEHSETRAKVLFRTAHPNLDFLPDFVRDRIAFQHVDPKWLSTHDRVGTYTGTYIGSIL